MNSAPYMIIPRRPLSIVHYHKEVDGSIGIAPANGDAGAEHWLLLQGTKNVRDPQLVHNVFFTLSDNSPAAVQKMLDACKKYLTVQPGIVYFACGTRDPGLTRDVNVQDWHIGLHIVFTNRAAHDAYQNDAMHLRFVAENKANWKQVRVFDSLAETK